MISRPSHCKPRLRTTRRFVLLLAVVSAVLSPCIGPTGHLLLPYAQAESDSVLLIQGITVPCESCRRVGEETCSELRNGRTAVSNCDTILLARLGPTSKEKGLGFDTEQLVRRAHRGGDDDPVGRAAVNLLLEPERVWNSTSDFSTLLLERYPQTLRAALLKGLEQRTIIDNIWESMRVDKSNTLHHELLVLLGANRAKPDLDEVLREVPSSSLDEYRLFLASFILVKSGLPAEWPEVFELKNSIIERCSLATELRGPACVGLLKDLFRISPRRSSGVFAGRMFVELSRSSLTPRELHDWAESLDADLLPDVVRKPIFERILETIRIKGNVDERLHFLQSSLIGASVSLSASDPAIQSNLLALIVEGAHDLRDRSKDPEVVEELLTLSFRIDPAPNIRRNELLITRQEAVKNGQSMWGIIGTVVGGLCLVISAFIASYTRHRPARMMRENLAETGESLEAILMWLQLPIDANRQELTRAYRVRAKVLHPDVNSDSYEEFQSLQRRYNRALELMDRKLLTDEWTSKQPAS